MKKLYWVSIFTVFCLSCVTRVDESGLAVEYFNVGNAFLEIEQFDKAVEYYNKVLDIDTDFHKARYNLIYIYVRRSDFKNAGKNIAYLELLGDENLKVKRLSAYVKYSEGKLEEALDLYVGVYNRGDHSEEIQLNIVKLYYQLGKYSEAMVFLEELLLGKEDAELFFLAALVAEGAGDLQLATEYYEVCIELGDVDEALYTNTLALYVLLDDFVNQKRILELIVGNSADDDQIANAFFELSKILLFEDNNFSEGYKSLESAIGAGFKDGDRALKLLNSPDLIDIEKIRALFMDNNILKK